MTDDRPIGRLPPWLSFGLLAFAVGALGWFIGRDLSSLGALRRANPGEIAVILGLQVLYLIPESYRQKVVIDAAARTRLPSLGWFRLFVVGRFLNSLVPQAGNVYRALRLRADFGVRYSDFGASLGAFLVLSVVLNLGLASILLALQGSEDTLGSLPAWTVLAGAALIVFLAPILLWRLTRDATLPHNRLGSLIGLLRTMLAGAVEISVRPKVILRFLVAWFATLVVVVGLYGTVISLVGGSLTIGKIVALYALVQATTFVVITPGNLGIQELGFAALAGAFGVPLAQGAVAAAVIRASGWIAVAIPALVLGSADVVGYLRREPAEPPR